MKHQNQNTPDTNHNVIRSDNPEQTPMGTTANDSVESTPTDGPEELIEVRSFATGFGEGFNAGYAQGHDDTTDEDEETEENDLPLHFHPLISLFIFVTFVLAVMALVGSVISEYRFNDHDERIVRVNARAADIELTDEVQAKRIEELNAKIEELNAKIEELESSINLNHTTPQDQPEPSSDGHDQLTPLDVFRMTFHNQSLHPEELAATLQLVTTSDNGSMTFTDADLIEEGSAYLVTFKANREGKALPDGSYWIEYTDFLRANQLGQIILYYNDGEDKTAVGEIQFEANPDQGLWLSRGPISVSKTQIGFYLYPERLTNQRGTPSATRKTVNNISVIIYGESILAADAR